MAGMRLTQKERAELAVADIDVIADYGYNLLKMGKNRTLLLDEFGRRMNLPGDTVSIMAIRETKETCLIHIWSNWEEERLEAFRNMPDRNWSLHTHCNKITCPLADKEKRLDSLKDLFAVSLIVEDDGYYLLEGEGSKTWHEPIAHAVSDKVYEFNLADVLSKYQMTRPNDEVISIALHGEGDEEYRSLFGKGLPASKETLREFDLKTRYTELLFRIGIADGPPRHLAYSLPDQSVLGVTFHDTRKGGAEIAKFKESQKRNVFPILEQDERIVRLLTSYAELRDKGPSQTPPKRNTLQRLDLT